MHNLKEIRKDFSNFEKSLEKRFLKVDFNDLQKLDEQNRDLIQKKEALEKKKIFQNLKMKVYLKNQKKFLLNWKKYLINKKKLKLN